MFRKWPLALCAATIVLLTGAPVALASHLGDERDSGLSVHQTELDEQYARTHSAITHGGPTKNGAPYGYVTPHHRIIRHPLPGTGISRQ